MQEESFEGANKGFCNINALYCAMKSNNSLAMEHMICIYKASHSVPGIST